MCPNTQALPLFGSHPHHLRPPPCPPPLPALQRSDEIGAEKNRALKAALNAELRKTKATLLEQAIPLLDKMARKGKGLTPEKIQARQQLVAELRQAIEEVADGVHSARKPQRVSGVGAGPGWAPACAACGVAVACLGEN